jgi:hypothetical protein
MLGPAEQNLVRIYKDGIHSHVLIIWNSLLSVENVRCEPKKNSSRIPLTISTSFGMKLTSSWTSKHGCRASLRMRSPVPNDRGFKHIYVEITRLPTSLRDFGFHIGFGCVHRDVGKAKQQVRADS